MDWKLVVCDSLRTCKSAVGVKIYFLGSFPFQQMQIPCKNKFNIAEIKPYELRPRFCFVFSYCCCFFFIYFFLIGFFSRFDSVCCSNIVASFYNLIIWLFKNVFVYEKKSLNSSQKNS